MNLSILIIKKIFLPLTLFYLIFFSLNNLIFIVRYGHVVSLRVYSTLKMTAPLFFFTLFKMYDLNIKFNKIYYGTILFCITFLTLLWQFNVKFVHIFGFQWTYIAVIEYLLFSFIYFKLLTRKFRNHFKVFILVCFFLVASGVIYEIPLRLHKQSAEANLRVFINQNHPFILHSGWIMLIAGIREVGIKAFFNIDVLPSFILLMLGLALLHFIVMPNDFVKALVRLPILVFWCIPFYKLKKE